MKPECLPVACELFTQWRRTRGDRSEVSTRPFSRNWEDLLSAAAIVAADDRAAAERDIRALASAGWVALKSVRYKAHFLDRVTIPLDQESRWKEAFGFVPPTDEETRLIQAYPWQAELAFLRDERVNLSFEELRRIDAFLAGGGRQRGAVPIKERSLEILGDEKRLDLLVNSALIRSGRLTLDQLRCEFVAEPLGWRRGPGSTPAAAPVLVVENCATWHSLVRWNQSAAQYRAVIYGRGNSFIDSVSELPALFTELGGHGPIEYFGDLDPAGLRIARRAHEEAIQGGLPAIQPASWCYEALLNHRSIASPDEGELEVVEADLAWLGALAETARELFRSHRRLAQEHVGWEYLLKSLSPTT